MTDANARFLRVRRGCLGDERKRREVRVRSHDECGVVGRHLCPRQANDDILYDFGVRHVTPACQFIGAVAAIVDDDVPFDQGVVVRPGGTAAQLKPDPDQLTVDRVGSLLQHVVADHIDPAVRKIDEPTVIAIQCRHHAVLDGGSGSSALDFVSLILASQKVAAADDQGVNPIDVDAMRLPVTAQPFEPAVLDDDGAAWIVAGEHALFAAMEVDILKGQIPPFLPNCGPVAARHAHARYLQAADDGVVALDHQGGLATDSRVLEMRAGPFDGEIMGPDGGSLPPDPRQDRNGIAVLGSVERLLDAEKRLIADGGTGLISRPIVSSGSASIGTIKADLR